MKAMIKRIKKSLKKSIRRILGIRILQRFFETLHKVSLIGMNIGGGDNPTDSGEKKVLAYINMRYQRNHEFIIFDVGANIGSYSLIANEIFDGKAIIHAFEPSRKTYLKLVSRCSEFQTIVPHNLGFGDRNGTATLYTQDEGSVLASMYPRNLDPVDMDLSLTETFEIRTIDSFCKENGIEKIHFLKLDVEGNEYSILQGSLLMLQRNAIDYIQFEFGGCNIASRTYLQDFFDLLQEKYQLFRVVKDGLFPITHYKEQYEIFIGANYFAERKNMLV